jgi:hypothetical protein
MRLKKNRARKEFNYMTMSSDGRLSTLKGHYLTRFATISLSSGEPIKHLHMRAGILETRAVEYESEGILGGVGVGKNVPTPTSI